MVRTLSASSRSTSIKQISTRCQQPQNIRKRVECCLIEKPKKKKKKKKVRGCLAKGNCRGSFYWKTDVVYCGFLNPGVFSKEIDACALFFTLPFRPQKRD